MFLKFAVSNIIPLTIASPHPAPEPFLKSKSTWTPTIKGCGRLTKNLNVMKPKNKMRPFSRLALGLVAALSLSSCVDSSYDFSKDIDMTMGLGSEGLGVRFGNTERITLENMLKVDKSVRLENGTNRYYLVENGTAHMEFDVDRVTAEISNTLVHTSYRALSYESARQQYEQSYGHTIPEGTAIPIPANFSPTGDAEGYADMDFTVGKVPEAITELNHVDVNPVKISVYIRNACTDGVKFRLKHIQDCKINIPKILHVASTTAGTLSSDNVLTIGSLDCTYNSKVVEVTIDRLDLGKDNTPNANHEIILSKENLSINFSGNATFETQQAFSMSPSDYADVSFDIVVNGKSDSEKTTVVATTATGRFNPEIAPEVSPIEIGSDLPDFLQDADVRIAVTNPTLRFNADMTYIPVDLDFSGELTSVLSGQTLSTVDLPASGKARLTARQRNMLYFYQGTSPYDPEQPASEATGTYKVDNISSLITRLPDEIDINLKKGRVSVPQDKEYTIALGESYLAATDYAVFVPFEFKDGLTIVYNDTTGSMHSDLKDLAADGVRLTGNVESNVPLALVATMTALDVDGNVMDGIKFSELHIAAGDGSETPTTSAVDMTAKLDNPKDLQRVDRIVFHVRAESGESAESHSLVSTQYLRLTDIRLKLMGRIIGDFN